MQNWTLGQAGQTNPIKPNQTQYELADPYGQASQNLQTGDQFKTGWQAANFERTYGLRINFGGLLLFVLRLLKFQQEPEMCSSEAAKAIHGICRHI